MVFFSFFHQSGDLTFVKISLFFIRCGYPAHRESNQSRLLEMQVAHQLIYTGKREMNWTSQGNLSAHCSLNFVMETEPVIEPGSHLWTSATLTARSQAQLKRVNM